MSSNWLEQAKKKLDKDNSNKKLTGLKPVIKQKSFSQIQSTNNVKQIKQYTKQENIKKEQKDDKEDNFDFNDIDIKPIEYIDFQKILIFGEKGAGKTTFALSMQGKKVVLQFDGLSILIKHNLYNDSEDIIVYDCVKLINNAKEKDLVESAYKQYKYILKIAEYYRDKGVDWIIVDGTERLVKIAELVMRYEKSLLPFQGISNLNVWKRRNMILEHLDNEFSKTAKKGVIYTVYADFRDIYEQGSIKHTIKGPKWSDYLRDRVFTVIEVYRDQQDIVKFYAKIHSSKTKMFPDGELIDVTNIYKGGYIK